jgi:hypothetical protein
MHCSLKKSPKRYCFERHCASSSSLTHKGRGRRFFFPSFTASVCLSPSMMKKIGGCPSNPTPTLWLDRGSSSLSPFSPFINTRGEREVREEEKKGWDYREENEEKQKKERNKRKKRKRERTEKKKEGEEIIEK